MWVQMGLSQLVLCGMSSELELGFLVMPIGFLNSRIMCKVAKQAPMVICTNSFHL
jgi:hypothetical protein